MQNVNPKSRRARSRGVLFCLSPAPSSRLVTWLPRRREPHTDVLRGTRCDYFLFFPILINLSVWSRAEFDLESECSFHPLCHLLKCLSGTLLKATLRACTRIANMQVPSRNCFFTCFYHLLKNASHNSSVVVRNRSHANCCCSE